MTNYYSEFNLSPGMSSDEICSELYKQKRKWITRQNSADMDKRQLAEQKTALIEEAVIVFSDSLKRSEYDRKLAAETKDSNRTYQQGDQQYQQQYQQQSQQRFTDEQVLNEIINLYNSGNSEATINRCTRFIEQGYRLPDIYYYLGQSYWEINQINMAVAAFKNGINASATDNDAKFYGCLANIYLVTLKNPDEAKPYIEKAIKEDPTNSYYQSIEILRMLYIGEVTQAEMKVVQHLNAFPQDVDYKNWVSEAYLAFSDSFFKNADNGGSYIDTVEDYNSVMYWRKKADELAGSERTSQLLKDWEKYGEKTFNKDNLKGIIILGLFCLSPSIILFGPILGVVIYLSYKPQWEFDKMAVTGQRDIGNSIVRVFSAIVEFILRFIAGLFGIRW